MKILLIHYRFFMTGGPERYMFNVINSLEERGHKVIPFSIKNDNNVPTKYSNYFVENIGKSNEVFIDKYPKTIRSYFDLIDREFYSKKVRKTLEKLIENERPDVCYLLVYKRALSPSVIDACKKYKIPIVNRISDYNPVCGAGSMYRNGQYCELCMKNDFECVKNRCIKNKLLFSLIRYFSIKSFKKKEFCKKIDAFVCTNQFMMEKMEEYGYEKQKLHLIPTFFKENAHLKSMDKSNHIDDKIEFLFIGNIDESKGIYDLLSAVSLLIKEQKNFHLTIIGGLHAKENEKITNFVTTNNLTSFVTILPFIKNEEVFSYYLKCNLTIIPTRWVENLPNILIESIYFMRPVVVPNFGSFKYTIDDTVAFKFEPLSVESLFETLKEICLNKENILKKSAFCQKYFEDHFSEESHLNKLIGLFEEVKR